jgi:hypothetical protein
MSEFGDVYFRENYCIAGATRTTVTFEEVFESLSIDAKEELAFNLDLFQK